MKTIRRLSGEAAEAAGLPWDSEYDDADLQIDVSLEDGGRSNWATIRSTRLRRSATRNVPCLT
ncbi:MAG: hypothetical protein ACLR8P_03175 [Clostridium fessum]